MSNPALTSEELHGLAFSIAYRMLGTVSDAQDVVQEAMLRVHKAEQKGVQVEHPNAYLASVTTRLALDYLGSARVRRETYIGPWLPEPMVEGSPVVARTEMMESLSMAFLVLLETLSPTERAVFLLREVFDYEYAEVAAMVGKKEAACRQIFARAKQHIAAGKPRFEASGERRQELADEFFAACEGGNLDTLVQLLSEDSMFFGDGGGKALAARQPVLGAPRIAKLILGLFLKGKQAHFKVRRADVNGQPGAMFLDENDRLISVLCLDIADNAVTAIRVVVNPDKLRHLGPLSDLTALPPPVRH